MNSNEGKGNEIEVGVVEVVELSEVGGEDIC